MSLLETSLKEEEQPDEYVASNAQRKTDQRPHIKHKVVKFSTKMKDQAVRWLSEEKWSPEIISFEGNKTGKCPMSIESLYQWIWQSKHGNKASDKQYKKIYNHLKDGRRRRKRGSRKDSKPLFTTGFLLKIGARL